MIAKSGTMMLAVLVIGSAMLAGAAQPAEAKMSDTAKVIAGFAAGFVLADVLDDKGSRRHNQPRYQHTKHRSHYRPPMPVVRVEHRPVWRPSHGHRPAFRHGYRAGYRHGYSDGYRNGYRDGWHDGKRARHMRGCF